MFTRKEALVITVLLFVFTKKLLDIYWITKYNKSYNKQKGGLKLCHLLQQKKCLKNQ